MGRSRQIPLPRQRQWMTSAACIGIPVDAFYPEKGGHPGAEALAACCRCPVSRECLEYALAGDEWGIWAGLSEAARRKLGALRPVLRQERVA